MGCTKDYLSKVLCNAHRSILETLIAAEQFDAAEKYLWGSCEQCYVTFDPNKKRFRYAEIEIYKQDPSQTTLALWEIFSFAMLDLSKRNRWDGTY